MRLFLLAALFACSLSACSQSKAKKATTPGGKQSVTAVAGLPLGKYSVYQSGGYGSFNYQYAFYLLNDHQYKMYDKVGSYTFSPATNALKFTSGEIQDYIGLFTHIKYNNETGGPMIVLNFWGDGQTPDSTQVPHKPLGNYQYAYYRANEK